jgi:hypothetical protein
MHKTATAKSIPPDSIMSSFSIGASESAAQPRLASAIPGCMVAEKAAH